MSLNAVITIAVELSETIYIYIQLNVTNHLRLLFIDPTWTTVFLCRRKNVTHVPL